MLTLVSKLFNLLRKSASSGEVIRIMFSFCTMTLANSRSSSFSRISAKVLYIRSVLRLRQSCRMIRLPRESRRPRSVLKSSRRLFMNSLK